MNATSRYLKILAVVTAVNAFTLTPLMGFVVGDKRPDVVATALMMLTAVALMAASVVAQLISRARRRAAGPDRVEARKQALDLGLPWVEADGTLARAKPTDQEVHSSLHARRWEAEARFEWSSEGEPTGPAADPVDVAYEAVYGTGPVGYHVEGCRCSRIFSSLGREYVSKDARCKDLR
jgi:hypothetical protein